MSHKGSQKTHSRQSNGLGSAEFSHAFGEAIKMTEDSREKVAAINHFLYNRFVVREITQKLAELSYKCLLS